MKACCDYELDKDFYVYDDNFVSNYKNGKIHEEVERCWDDEGCLYGIIWSHYYLNLKHFIEKAIFNFEKNVPIRI